LHELAVEQLEKLEETSKTSSRPLSSDNPFKKGKSNIPLEVPSSPEEAKDTEIGEESKPGNEEPPTEPPSKQPKGFSGPKRKQENSPVPKDNGEALH